jgi:glycosyltransferase involved in cell wall biosynthesis
MKPCKVSIIIPVYNGSLLIKRCLNSVFNQNGDYILEVIVIDDGSTDNSLEVLEDYPQPLIILKQANQGPAAARNKGIENATGNYLAFLDADDYWKPTFLKETVSFLEANPEAIAVSVGQIHKIIGKEDSVMPQLLNEEHNIQKGGNVLNNFYQFWAIHNHVCTGSVLMKTAIVNQTGGQRSELRITEDLEFWAYLATFGNWGFIPKILFISDGGAVTKEQGWLKKNKKRWASAPTLEQWASRISHRVPKELTRTFNMAKGKIAKNLAYAMLMSNREELARQTTLKNKEFYPKDKVAFLMVKSSVNKLFWYILAKVIYLRERFKRI